MQYISVEHQRAISERYKIASIIVLAFCASVVMFIVVGRFIPPPGIVPGTERLIPIIQVVVIVLAFFIIVFRRVWMSALVMAGAPRSGVNTVLKRLMVMSIICAVLSEFVAIIGLVF